MPGFPGGTGWYDRIRAKHYAAWGGGKPPTQPRICAVLPNTYNRRCRAKNVSRPLATGARAIVGVRPFAPFQRESLERRLRHCSGHPGNPIEYPAIRLPSREPPQNSWSIGRGRLTKPDFPQVAPSTTLTAVDRHKRRHLLPMLASRVGWGSSLSEPRSQRPVMPLNMAMEPAQQPLGDRRPFLDIQWPLQSCDCLADQ